MYFNLINLLEGTKLAYNLQHADHALIFQVTEQTPDISAFLKNNTYRASNGLLVAGSEYPEFKDSENTVFLQGTDRVANYKLDVTRFVSNNVRDKKAVMVKQALKEFVGYIKKLSAPYRVAYRPASRCGNTTLVILD